MTLPSLVRRIVRSGPAAFCLAAAIGASPAVGREASAQRPDTARAPARDTIRPTLRDTTVRPPISPRRAFVTSLVAPGYAQSILGRPNAATLFVVAEAIFLIMVRESAIELRNARQLEADSVPLYFVNPESGLADTIYGGARYSSELVQARRAHLEDWIAALVANHLIAAADGFVAAHLWEVPVRVGLRPTPDGLALSARYRW